MTHPFFCCVIRYTAIMPSGGSRKNRRAYRLRWFRLRWWREARALPRQSRSLQALESWEFWKRCIYRNDCVKPKDQREFIRFGLARNCTFKKGFSPRFFLSTNFWESIFLPTNFTNFRASECKTERIYQFLFAHEFHEFTLIPFNE